MPPSLSKAQSGHPNPNLVKAENDRIFPLVHVALQVQDGLVLLGKKQESERCQQRKDLGTVGLPK